MALATATLALTHSAGAMAAVLLCRGLPALILGPLLGPAIDRWPKRRVLYATDLARALLALGFVVAFGRRDLPLVYALAALLGLGSALFRPAQAAAMREILPAEAMVAANSRFTLSAGVVGVVGAALGGVSVARLGPDLAFGLNALSYIWSAAWIAGARWPGAVSGGRPAGPAGRYLGELRAGAAAVLGDRVTLATVLAAIGFALTAGPYFVAPPVLGDLVYGRGSLGIGLLEAADGVGFILASLVVQRLGGAGPRSLRRLYGLSYLAQGVLLTLFCLSTRLWQGMAAILAAQVASGVILTLTPSLLQMRVAPSLQGRVFALETAVAAGAGQLSIALAGWLMAVHGVAAVALPVGVVCALASVVFLRLASDGAMAAPAAPAAGA